MQSNLEDIAQISGEIDYGDAHNIMELANKDAAFRKKVRALVDDWEDAAEADDESEMARIAKELKSWFRLNQKPKPKTRIWSTSGLTPNSRT